MDDADLLARIAAEPGKMGGKPVIRGRRVTPSMVLTMLAKGASREAVERCRSRMRPRERDQDQAIETSRFCLQETGDNRTAELNRQRFPALAACRWTISGEGL